MLILIIVAIGWMYVVVLMALTQGSVLAGLGTLLFYGLLPLSITLYLMATPLRRRRRQQLHEQPRDDLPGDGPGSA